MSPWFPILYLSLSRLSTFGSGLVRPSPLPASLPTNAPTEQEILEHMSGGLSGLNISLPPALVNYLATHPLNKELLLLVGLNYWDISVENILQ